MWAGEELKRAREDCRVGGLGEEGILVDGHVLRTET